MSTLFFYGTLLHPDILKRVLAHDGASLSVAPALLPRYTRLLVQRCDYPAITPSEHTEVRGAVVSGLSPEDLRLLDIFEGHEYSRQSVSVYPLSPFSPLHTLSIPSTPLADLTHSIQAYTYIWNDPLTRLSTQIWSYDYFLTHSLWKWLGKHSNHNPDYALVDQQRPPRNPPFPEFGRALLSQFCFDKDYVNLNHGSFGSLPRPVLEATNALTLQIEANPDKFIRRTFFPLSAAVRESLAAFVNAHPDEIVMVPNASHGVNTVLRNFVWGKGDVLVQTTTTYGAVSRMLQYIHDLPPHPRISTMPLTFPTSHAAILAQFRAHLRSIRDGNGDKDKDARNNTPHPPRKILAIIDGITSNPGCTLPWQDMVRICKEENVWSVVDAAHCIGQGRVDLSVAQPDFWVSNCHKWLFAKRGCAVLYVPRRNQHIIRSTFPTSFGYVSEFVGEQTEGLGKDSALHAAKDAAKDEDSAPHAPKDEDKNEEKEKDKDKDTEARNAMNNLPLNFVGQFEYNGTIDCVPYLSVKAALDFRASLGGEERIYAYCHSLALRGGKRLAQLLQTEVLDGDGELTGCMVNVRLPLSIPTQATHEDTEQVRFRMEDKLMEEWNCFAAVFVHDGKWWVRCSAQVWNEMADFDHVAKALAAVCAEFRNEQA